MMMMHPQSQPVLKKRQYISKRNRTPTPTPTSSSLEPSHQVTKKKKRQYISKRKKKTTATTQTTTTTTSSSSSSEPSLPHDIFYFHILPKLPVRSLLRFNSVSKLWYTTIQDPNFQAYQLSHAKSNSSLVAMLRAGSTFIRIFQLLKEEEEEEEGGGHYHQHHHPDSNNNNNIACLELDSAASIILGTCNGLTCNIIPSATQICNPSTRELLNFPNPKPTTQMPWIYVPRHKGFGFDPLMNEYKVMSVWIDSHQNYDCWVYTLGTNKWRNVTSTCNCPPFYVPADLTPICISGTLFWSTYRMGRILSFDLHHEKFHLIACPKVPQGLILHTLFDREGRLCLVYRYDDHLKDEVQLTLFTCKDHQQFRLGHIPSSARWIRLECIRLPLKPGIKLIRVAEFAKQIYLHWVTRDGHFTLWDVNRKRWIHNKLLRLSTTQWVLLVNHAENLLSLKTFVPTSAGEVEVKYLSSRDAKHEDPYRGNKRHKRFVFDSHGYRTTPYWFSVII